MEIRLYNTLTRRTEPLRPIDEGRVGMYHCGPTVYQRPHIGNYRAFLFADLLRRSLELAGLEVLQVMNITDVGHLLNDADEGEDKLEAQARKDKVDPWTIVADVSRSFFVDLAALGIKPAHHYPRASEHIPEMVAMVERLLASGNAYQVGENIYFDVHSFPEYGRLSGNRVAELEAGARLAINDEKRHPADFALWKSDPQHIMKWETVFGAHGFPGWHIECSAMSQRYLGPHFDIHTGGEDNIFPHHECEIAQAECANQCTFVNVWMHTRFLQVDGGKMSKSLGNVYSLDDLVAHGYSPLDFRFLVLRAHYRGSLNFTWEVLAGAAEARRSLHDLRGRLAADARGVRAGTSSVVALAEQAFRKALADDLNTSAALAAVFELRNVYLRDGLPPPEAAAALDFLVGPVNQVLGIFTSQETPHAGLSDVEVEELIAQRSAARAAKDWARADEIRDLLQAEGIVTEDRPDGVHWHRG